MQAGQGRAGQGRAAHGSAAADQQQNNNKQAVTNDNWWGTEAGGSALRAVAFGGIRVLTHENTNTDCSSCRQKAESSGRTSRWRRGRPHSARRLRAVPSKIRRLFARRRLRCLWLEWSALGCCERNARQRTNVKTTPFNNPHSPSVLCNFNNFLHCTLVAECVGRRCTPGLFFKHAQTCKWRCATWALRGHEHAAKKGGSRLAPSSCCVRNARYLFSIAREQCNGDVVAQSHISTQQPGTTAGRANLLDNE